MHDIAEQVYNYDSDHSSQGYVNVDKKVQHTSLLHILPKREIRKLTTELSIITMDSSLLIYLSKCSTTWIDRTV